MTEETQTADEEDPKEEFFGNEATDVEIEDVEGPQQSVKPWDPSKIRINTKPFSLRQVVDMINDGDIDLAPDFQRLFVWKSAQRSRLIESVLLGIPLPAFYFSQDTEGKMQVVDGVKRLTTIHEFVTKAMPLTNLEYLRQLEGLTFEKLDKVDSQLRRRFQQTQIVVNVLEPQTPDEVKFDIFKRINTGGNPLTAQEIRHCMSRSRSRAFLKDLVALPSFQTATNRAFKQEKRMADREVALRFCAFRNLDKVDEYQKFPSLDSFLLDFTRQLDAVHKDKPPLVEADLERLRSDFDRAMRTAAAVLGKFAFRKYRTGVPKPGPINRALFESWAAAFADYEPEQLIPRATEIRHALGTRMTEHEYHAAISQGTGDAAKVKLRFQVARDILKSFG